MNAVKRWPHIARFLSLAESMSMGYAMLSFEKETMSPADRAAANEEWVEYFEYRLAQRAGELANDPVKRNLAEKWTDNMVYMSRRCAALARGEDPGPWIPQWERRPDLEMSTN